MADATSMFTVDLDIDVKSMGTLFLRCEVCKGIHTPFVDTGVEPLKLFHGFPGRAVDLPFAPIGVVSMETCVLGSLESLFGR